MKAKLKTAEYYAKRIAEITRRGSYEDWIKGFSEEIESARNEALDHVRQQLEAREREEGNERNNAPEEYKLLYTAKQNCFKEAISLIDQLKAETKNT